jgi:hypothetical protein
MCLTLSPFHSKAVMVLYLLIESLMRYLIYSNLYYYYYYYSSISKIIFLTFLLFVYSSPSSCIDYSLLLFSSFAYFTIILALNCFFLLIYCLKFVLQIILWCIFIFSLDTPFQSQILINPNHISNLINLCEFSAYDTYSLL